MDAITGIYQGEVLEDFIITATSMNRPFLKVRVTPFHKDVPADNIPLTYVQSQFWIYPIKQGDKVYVKFTDDNLTIPVLWGVDFQFPPSFLSQFTFPDPGSLVTFPVAEDNFSALYLSEDFYILSTATYRVIHYKNSVEVLTETKRILYSANQEFLSSTSEKHEISGSNTLIIMDSSGIRVDGTAIKLGAAADLSRKPCARRDDATLSDATTDAAYWLWLSTLQTILQTFLTAAALSVTDPVLSAAAGTAATALGLNVPPTQQVGKINAGSSKTTVE